jgi:hypothetical protein|tara:strand:+ start:16488 stop:16670 length:183 start_codon:yes stop_codon:yes gene_type:complete
MPAKKNDIRITLTEKDFQDFPNDQDLGRMARQKYISTLKVVTPPKDYKNYNWVYPGPTKL